MRFETVRGWRGDEAAAGVPAERGILIIEFLNGRPYACRSANLRKRFLRLLRARDGQAKSLAAAVRKVRYRTTGSVFESDLALYGALRRLRPRSYRDVLKLRWPFYVKILLGNRYPRTCLTQRLTASKAAFYGPFPTRGAAERFQGAVLDLFLVRRCVENLEPSPSHPGCVWGELRLCLRPCQAACDDSRYAREVKRMTAFLASDGESLVADAAAARDRASAQLDFEAAARHHRTWSKARAALRLGGGLIRDLQHQCGVIIQASAEQGCAELTPLYRGSLQPPMRLRLGAEPTRAGIEASVRSGLDGAAWRPAPPSETQDHLALLHRWHASSFRRGCFVRLEKPDAPPLRRLARAVLKVAGPDSAEY